MEMMGGEFCGNATRAYAMYVARQRGGLSEVRLRVSGCDHVVTAAVDLARGAARAEMPLPRAVRAAEVEGHAGTLVDLAGIAHLVIEGVAPSEDFFRAAEPLFSAIEGLDAYGVIFLDRTSHRMTPLVKVVDTGTLIWEGAAAAAPSPAPSPRVQGSRTASLSRTISSPRASSARASSAAAARLFPPPSAAPSPSTSPCASRCKPSPTERLKFLNDTEKVARESCLPSLLHFGTILTSYPDRENRTLQHIVSGGTFT